MAAEKHLHEERESGRAVYLKNEGLKILLKIKIVIIIIKAAENYTTKEDNMIIKWRVIISKCRVVIIITLKISRYFVEK